jgi:hypothetical protein
MSRRLEPEIGHQPRESAGNWVRRHWRSRKKYPPFKRWLFTWGISLLVLELVLFALTALLNGDAGEALDVVLGTKSPFETKADVVAVVLAILNVLLVPAIVGALAALVVEGQLSDMRSRVIDEVTERLTRLYAPREVGSAESARADAREEMGGQEAEQDHKAAT